MFAEGFFGDCFADSSSDKLVKLKKKENGLSLF